jgi:hypothetical protein
MPTDPSRLLAEARLLLAWGHLESLGVPLEQTSRALADDLEPDPLAEVARAAGRGSLASALQSAPLSSWVRALLEGPERAQALVGAGEHLAEEAQAPGRAGWTWRKLSLLHTAQAAPAEALGALARSARDHGWITQAEALYAAARAAREGDDLRGALLAAAGSFPPLAEVALRRLEDPAIELSQVCEALTGLDAVSLPEEEPSSAGGLGELAQAASERAAPLRRGLGRVLSDLESALGLQRGSSPHADLAREAVSSRGERAAAAPAPDAQADPPEPKQVGGEASADPDADPAHPGRAKKTIGGDSGPVRLDDEPSPSR